MITRQLNGKNTQGENIADNGGIHESFRLKLHFAFLDNYKNDNVSIEQGIKSLIQK